MPSRRHANARTTPEMREFIRNSDLSVAALARLLNISETTVRKWKRRASVEDASHKPLHLRTTLSPVQEYAAVELRKSLLLSLDELLQVIHEYINPDVSRAGLARCLKRHGVSRLDGIQDDDYIENDSEEPVCMALEHIPTHQAIKPEISPQALAACLSEGDENKETDVVNVKSVRLPVLSDEQPECGLFFAFDPETRWVYVDIYDDEPIGAARRYIMRALRKAPFHVARTLAANYTEFMQRYRPIAEGDQSSSSTSAGNPE